MTASAALFRTSRGARPRLVEFDECSQSHQQSPAGLGGVFERQTYRKVIKHTFRGLFVLAAGLQTGLDSSSKTRRQIRHRQHPSSIAKSY